MALGKKKTVGLDIGSGLVKLAVVEHGKGDPQLVHVAMAPMLADAIVDGEVMDPGVVADTVKSILAGVKQKKVVAAVGGRDVIIKKIQVDRMKESEAADVVQWEAQQHVPFDIEGVEMDFQVLNPEGADVQMDVLLVAAKRELVASRVSLVSDIGLQSAIIEVDAFALHNAFELNYPETVQQVVALVNIGNEVTNVNISDRGVPVLTRDLTVGTRHFREDLQRDHGMSADDADGILVGGEPRQELQPYVQNRGEEIAVGVERAGAFLQAAARDAQNLQHVYLSGGGARIPGLADALQARLRLPVEIADPLRRLGVKGGVFEGADVDSLAPLFMMSIGLALRT